MRPDNPVRGVERFADGQRKRRLTDDEYADLGVALRKAEKGSAIWPPAIALTRFLLLTGWRRGEGIGLRGAEIDLGRRTATFGDLKTGRSMRPLSNAATELLRIEKRQHANLMALISGFARARPDDWLSEVLGADRKACRLAG